MPPGSSESAEPVLRCREVSKRYGPHTALDRVTLAVRPGETVALVGESGSGKTTLLRLFNGLVIPDEGAVWVEGVTVAGSDPVALRRGVGYVPQEGGLLPHWTVLRNAGLVPRLLGRSDADAAAAAALEGVGLGGGTFGTRYPSQLSGGQRQRVALARALAAGPRLVLLDEPFGALDAITKAELLELFARVLAPASASALLVTHDLRVAFRLGHRVAVMRRGRIVQCDVPQALRDAPADPYVTELLARAGVAA